MPRQRIFIALQSTERMEAAEDDELQLLRISESLVADLQKLLRRVLWKKPRSKKADELKVHRYVKLRDLDRLILKVWTCLVILNGMLTTCID